MDDLLLRTSLADMAACLVSSRRLQEAVRSALAQLRVYSTDVCTEFSHERVGHLFGFLACHCAQLEHISCCFARHRQHSGRQLEAGLLRLAPASPRLVSLTLLNVEVTEAALAGVAAHCTALRRLALGLTEGSAFGCTVPAEALRKLADSCPRLEALALFRCVAVDNAALAAVARAARRLARLVLHNCPQVSAAGIIAVAEAAPQLRELDVLVADNGPRVSCLTFESCFALAANCSGLEVVRVSEELLRVSVLDDAALALLARGCPSLRHLDLVQVEAGDLLLCEVASHCPRLESLRLEQTYATDAGVAAVASSCRALSELRVAGCSPHCWMLPAELMFPGITEVALEPLGRAGCALRELDLSGLAPASDLPGTDAPPPSPAATPRARAPPPPLIAPALVARLRRLCLDWLKLDGPLLQGRLEGVMAAAVQLVELSLAGCREDVGQLLAAAARARPPLRSLCLQHTAVRDSALAQLRLGFPGLVQLKLSYCRAVTDEGLRALAPLADLQRLCLYNTPQVTDVGICRLLQRCHSLGHLVVGHHTGALHASARQGLKKLAAGEHPALPGCAAGRVQLLTRQLGGESQFEQRTLAAVMAL